MFPLLFAASLMLLAFATSVVLYPAMMIYVCSKNRWLSKPAKRQWIAALLFLWPLSSFVYSAVIERDKLLNLIGIFNAAMLSFLAVIAMRHL